MPASTTHNRLAGHLADADLLPEPDLPTCPHARQRMYDDTVLLAVLALRRGLRSPDLKTSLAAAERIVDLEATRHRHGHHVSGCQPEPQEMGDDPRLRDAKAMGQVPPE